MNNLKQNMSIRGRMIFISLLFVFAIGFLSKTNKDLIPNHHVVSLICADNTNKLATIQAVPFSFLNPLCITIVDKLSGVDDIHNLRIAAYNRLNEQKFRVHKVKQIRIQPFYEFIYFHRNLPSHSDEIPI